MKNETQKTFPETTRNYIFDFDGTLVDSMPYFIPEMLNMLKRYNISYGPEIVQTLVPMGMKRTAEYFIELGIKLTPEQISAEILDSLEPHYYKDVVPKPCVFESLEYMKSKGIGLNVLTAGSHRWLDDCLKINGMYEFFDNVWSSDDFGIEKSNPLIYFNAAKRLGTEMENITFIDDNINACRAAKAAGMTTVGVYDEYSKDEAENFKEFADGYIMDFGELEEHIKESLLDF